MSRPNPSSHGACPLARRSRLPWLLLAALTSAGCDPPMHTETDRARTEEAFRCHVLLIGLDDGACTEDVVGPGTLRIAFRPDPERSSWELGIRGLAALAESCEFHGSYHSTRLSAVQGRGNTDIICPIPASTDRQYHEIRFQGREETPGTAINITVTFERPAP